MNTKSVVILVTLGATLATAGSHRIGTGVKKVAVGTYHVVHHVVRHPVDSVKYGAIHKK